MIPIPFEYTEARSAEDAVAILGEHGDDAKLLAGGHSLLPLLKLRLAAPAVLVDIGRVADLRYVRDEGAEIAVGALSRHHDLETSAILAEHAPILGRAASLVGDPQVRNRGTIGGSLVHGDAASDLPAVALALHGTLVVQGPAGRRAVPADDFFVGFLETAVEPDEMLVEIRVPKLHGAGCHYEKHNRRSQDYAIVAAAVVLGDEPRVTLANMASTPVRAREVEEALRNGASLPDAAALAAVDTAPLSDQHASADDRAELARVLVERSLLAAASSGREPGDLRG